MTSTATLHSTYLVQRLQKPVRLGQFKDNPFSFGGGIKNGGMSDEAMDLLRGIWSFDYMGSAEFEWGAVPKALTRIASADLTSFSFEVTLANVPAHWKDMSNEPPDGTTTIYAICPSDIATDVEGRIVDLAHGKVSRLKEDTRLQLALRPVDEWDTDTCGWLEIDNGFLFFTDAAMWEKASRLFGAVSA